MLASRMVTPHSMSDNNVAETAFYFDSRAAGSEFKSIGE